MTKQRPVIIETIKAIDFISKSRGLHSLFRMPIGDLDLIAGDLFRPILFEWISHNMNF